MYVKMCVFMCVCLISSLVNPLARAGWTVHDVQKEDKIQKNTYST